MRRKSRPARKSPDNLLRTHTFLAIQNLAHDVGLTSTHPSSSVPEAMTESDVVRAGQVAVRALGMWAGEMALALVADAPPLALDGRCAQDIVSAAQSLLCGKALPSRAADLTASLAEALRSVSLAAQSAPDGSPAQTSAPALYDAILPAMGVAMLCVRTYARLTPADPREALTLARGIREVCFHNGMRPERIRELAPRMKADVRSALTANLAPTGGIVDALGYVSGHIGRTGNPLRASVHARFVLDAGAAIRQSRSPAVHHAVTSGDHARALVGRALTAWVPRLAAWTIEKIQAGTSARRARRAGVAGLRERLDALAASPTTNDCNALAEFAHNVALEFYAEDEGAWQPEIEAAEALWRAGTGVDEASAMLGERSRGAQAAERVVEAVLCDGLAAMQPDEFLPIARDVVGDIARLVCSVAPVSDERP